MFCRNIKTSILILTILLSAFFGSVPQAQAMKRESFIQPTTLDEALNLSLAYGDSRRINWEGLGF